MGIFKIILATAFGLLITSSTYAMAVRLTGTRGISYRGLCKTSKGKKMKISGRVPETHKFSSKSPIVFCELRKIKRKGVLKLSVDQSRKIGHSLYIDSDASDIVVEIPNGQLSGGVKFAITEVDHRGQR